jgi:Mu transposase, C-terminal domain
MAIVTDRQIRCLRALLLSGKPLKVAAMRVDMDRKTARKYRDLARLPSEEEVWPRAWRTREDPFADVWEEVREKLELSPGLQANTLFAWLQQRYPGRFPDGQLRTLQRRLRQWRAAAGPPKEVFFAQTHYPGRLGASDFTHMTTLNVTLAGQPFDHMVFHFVLTYSNWEAASICFSESFESLSDGLQQALWELGGVPQRHRTDRLSAAVNNLSDQKEFTRRYQALMDHYGLIMEKINARQAHENGDAEQSHNRFKQAVDQALQLRGSRDFPDRIAYARFLREVLDQRNGGRQKQLAEERIAMAPLPSGRLESYKRARVRVGAGSEIRVDRNIYSIHSRLVGEKVDVRLYAEHLEVWYGGCVVERIPRLRGQGKHQINYRHVIDSLVRKPGAFENYKYRDDMFPTSRFRMAYDALRQATPSRAAREYLQILELAARENESLVDDALRMLLEEDQAITLSAVREWMGRRETARPVTDVQVEFTNLSSFDELFRHKEVWDGIGVGGETKVGGVPSRAPSAHVS